MLLIKLPAVQEGCLISGQLRPVSGLFSGHEEVAVALIGRSIGTCCNLDATFDGRFHTYVTHVPFQSAAVAPCGSPTF